MSRTMRKNGQRIVDAINAHMPEALNGRWLFFTVGEVAKWADVSRPTARKYINILVEHGQVEIARVTDYEVIYHWNEGARQ